MKEIEKLTVLKKAIGKVELIDISKIYKQILSHQIIYGQFSKVKILSEVELDGFEIVSAKKLGTLPFPRLINSYLEDIK